MKSHCRQQSSLDAVAGVVFLLVRTSHAQIIIAVQDSFLRDEGIAIKGCQGNGFAARVQTAQLDLFSGPSSGGGGIQIQFDISVTLDLELDEITGIAVTDPACDHFTGEFRGLTGGSLPGVIGIVASGEEMRIAVQ